MKLIEEKDNKISQLEALYNNTILKLNYMQTKLNEYSLMWNKTQTKLDENVKITTRLVRITEDEIHQLHLKLDNL